jgi:hypothetical protein
MGSGIAADHVGRSKIGESWTAAVTRCEAKTYRQGLSRFSRSYSGYNSTRRLLLHCAALWPMADGRCWPASDLQIPVPPLRAPWLLIGFVVAGRWAVELRQLRWWQLLVHEGSLDDNGQGQAARRE